MNDENRSPEEWEAADLIEALKASLPPPGTPVPQGACSLHPFMEQRQEATTRALIWIIRRLDLNGTKRQGWGAQTGVAGLAAGLVVGLVEVAKYVTGK